MSFSPEDVERYKRHILLPEIGGQGQQKLKAAKVAVVGVGGLGCPILSYLTMAGVGEITLIDGDHVELSNLQRQILFTENDIGRPKVRVAAERLAQMNSGAEIIPHQMYLDHENAGALISNCDLVIEGLDRFAPRYIVNDACQRYSIPFLSSAIGRFDGQVALFPMTEGSACYRCFVPTAPDDEAVCEREGVLGAVPGVVGSMAALEAIKWLVGMKTALRSEMLIYQGLAGHMRRVSIPKDPVCATCA